MKGPYDFLVSRMGREVQFVPASGAPITLRARPVKIKPDEMLAANLDDQSMRLYLGLDELTAASLPPPAPQDYFIVDGVKRHVMGPAEPLHWFNSELVGYRVTVRG